MWHMSIHEVDRDGCKLLSVPASEGVRVCPLVPLLTRSFLTVVSELRGERRTCWLKGQVQFQSLHESNQPSFLLQLDGRLFNSAQPVLKQKPWREFVKFQLVVFLQLEGALNTVKKSPSNQVSKKRTLVKLESINYTISEDLTPKELSEFWLPSSN